MAITATIATPLAVVPAGYLVKAYITISNSATYPVTIKQILPRIKSTPIAFLEDESSFKAIVPGAGGLVIPASGSTSITMQIVFHGSNNLGSYDVQNPNSVTYDLGCQIFPADNTTVVPTPATITVTQNNKGN